MDAVVICAPGAAATALEWIGPGGTILVFTDAGTLPADQIYRRELMVVGRRSASADAMHAAATILPELDLPEPTVLPLERFGEGLDLFLRRDAAKVVFVP
jgi:threonine dehydrogenase-like Zn-dependent dehydrogenase